MWTEPDATAVLSPPRELRLGTPQGSWFTDRPRPILLALAAGVAAFAIGFMGAGKLTLALAGVMGLGLVIAVLLRPVIGGLVLVAAVPTFSGLAPGFPVSHVRVSELLIGAIGVTVLVSARRSESVPWSSLDWLLLAYGAGWAIFGAIDGITLHEHMSLTDWGTIIGQFQFFLLYRAVRTSLRTPAQRRLAIVVLLVATVPVGLLAILQQLHVGAVVTFLNKVTGGLSAPNAAPGSGVSRATGPFANWAVLAGYLLPLLLVLWSLTMAGQIGRHRRAAWLIGVIALTALLLTAELSALIFLVIGVIVLATQYGYGRRALRFAGAALVVGALIATPFLAARFNQEFSSRAGSNRHAGVPQTLSFRWHVWTTQYIPAIEGRPISGYGIQLPSSVAWPYPESQYVEYLIEGGIPVLVLFGGLAWAMLRRTREASRLTDPFEQAIGRATFFTVVAMLSMNLIWPYLSNAGLPQVLWCLLAITVPNGLAHIENAPTLRTRSGLTLRGALR